ncbi:MAG: hypothetical protein SFW67_21610 [Myxococcaceae bacterium]|nr:hypothetical protein [Myxococcaceae bacterium]
MRTLLFVVLAPASMALAQQVIVNDAPSASELGRYQVLKANELTLKLDTQTGVTWSLCPHPKKAGKSTWCRFNANTLPAGPSGRYRIAEAFQIMLVDTVSGRSWGRCEDPTPEKRLGWCLIED